MAAIVLHGRHGGARPGAGRPLGSLGKKKLATKDIAHKILAGIDQEKAWRELMESEDQRIRLEALRYLSDRAYGKATQGIELQGGADFQIIVERIGA